MIVVAMEMRKSHFTSIQSDPFLILAGISVALMQYPCVASCEEATGWQVLRWI